MEKVDLSIIIVNYNVKEFLQNLIHSIYKAVNNITYEIIVVDNASVDGSVELIKEKFPDVILVANKDNVGFSKANNIGLKLSSGENILLLNPDTLVREDTFDTMIKFLADNPDAGLAGCKVISPNGAFYLPCRRGFPGPWTSFCKVSGLSSLFPKSRFFSRYNLTYLDENKTYEVDAVSGSFMILKREVYEKIGGLDEDFFMYGEDLDYCYRVQKAGYKVYYVHSTQIIHYAGESTKRNSFDETKVFYGAMHLFVKKHLSTFFLIEVILQAAIFFTRIFAFLNKRKVVVASIIMDFLLFNSVLKLIEIIRVNLTTWRGFPPENYSVIFTVPALIHIFIASSLGVYKKDKLPVLRNIAAVFIGFFIVSSLTFFFKDYAFSRVIVLVNYITMCFILSGWRILSRIIFKIGVENEGFSGRNVLIVGTNEPALIIAEKLKNHSTGIYKVSGLISLSAKDTGNKLNGLSIIGSTDNLPRIIRDNNIKEVIFSTEEISYNQMMSIVASCQNENAEFKLIGNNLDFLVGKKSVTILNDLSLLELNYNISSYKSRVIKKLLDFSLSAFVLFLVYPFIYLISRLTRNRSEFIKFILGVPSVFTGKSSFVGPKNPSKPGSLYLGKKGLTGLWFIENSEGEETEKLDIFYAKNQNIWLDLEILGRSLNKMWNNT